MLLLSPVLLAPGLLLPKPLLFFFLLPPVFAHLLPMLLPAAWLEPPLGILLPAPEIVPVLSATLPALVPKFVLLGTSIGAHFLTCLFVPLFALCLHPECLVPLPLLHLHLCY